MQLPLIPLAAALACCWLLACRVFHRTAPTQDRGFYANMEHHAAAAALLTITLCRSDAEYLRDHVMRTGFPVEVGSASHCMCLANGKVAISGT